MRVPSFVFASLASSVVAFAQDAGDAASIDPSAPPKGAVASGPSLTPLPQGTTAQLAPSTGGSDSCATAEVIFGTGAFAFDTSFATSGPEGQANTNCVFFGQIAIHNDVWFLWTAPANGTFQISTCGQTSVDTKIAVYTGAACPPTGTFTALTCNDDVTGTIRQSEAFVTCFVGDQFLIQLGNFFGAPGGTGLMTIDRLPLAGPAAGRWDDGTAETGLRAGFANNPICWIQGFGAAGDVTTITAVDVAWGTPLGSTLVNGQPTTIALWDDPNDDGDPNDAVLVQTVSTFTANVDSNIFSRIPFNPVVLTGGYFAGVSIVNPPTITSGYFPIPVDSTNCIVQPRLAWRAVATTPAFNFANLAANSTPPAAYSELAVTQNNPGLNGVLLLRAVATAESPGSVFCTGDGLDANHYFQCPCGNNGGVGRGCAWSGNPNGARLVATGHHLADDVRLFGTGMPASVTAIYLQGDTVGDAVFGDGVSCAGGVLIRLRNKSNVAGASSFPDASDTITLSQRGGVTPGSGAIRIYHTYYRNAATFCMPQTFNITNGWRIVW